MRILGIDPGTINMGVGVIDDRDGELTLVHADVLTAARSRSLGERLYDLFQELRKSIATWQPEVVAVEEPFVARNVRSAMAVGQAQAVAMLAASEGGIPIYAYSPRSVKQAVTDYGGSTKDQVQEMVKVLLGSPDLNMKSDASDALAVAICHVNARRAQDLVVLN